MGDGLFDRAGLKDADWQKLAYTTQACAEPDPFGSDVIVNAGVGEALDWLVKRLPTQVMQQRKEMIAQIEHASQLMHESGMCTKWLSGSDGHVQAVAGGVNGPIFEQLLKGSQYCDLECAMLLREGMGEIF